MTDDCAISMNEETWRALTGDRDELRARLAGAEAANAAADKVLVEHGELSGHIDIAEQCRDYLAHEATDDPSGKLQDFVDSLRIVIDQIEHQRRSRNWYESAYTAGKQKLIEHATEKLRSQLLAMTAARDELATIANEFLDPDLTGDRALLHRIAELRGVGK